MTNDLAKIFTKIEAAANKVDDLAAQILDAIKEYQADTLEDFNEMVGDAYEANGWSRQAGRPSEGSTLKPAPMTIRNYVSTIRKAYKAKLEVMRFDTLGQLRQAVKDLKAIKKQDVKQVDELAALRGVKIAQQEAMTGAVVHDIGVVLQHLDDANRAKLEAILQKAIKQFSKRAHMDLAA
jgi:hypothetical protein